MTGPCSPGSHPHVDRPNWEPADNIGDYMRNCREGLETWSECRAAKLMGMSRAHLWRMRQMANIPDDLFELLLDDARMGDHVPSTQEFAAIGQALASGHVDQSIEPQLYPGEDKFLRQMRRHTKCGYPPSPKQAAWLRKIMARRP